MGFPENLNTPWAVLAVLVIMLAVNGLLLYRYPAGPFAGAGPPSATEQTSVSMETVGQEATSPFEDAATVVATPEETTDTPAAPPVETRPPSDAPPEEVAPPDEPDYYGYQYYQY